jgi:hypothetical protein
MERPMATRWSPDTCACIIEFETVGEQLTNVVAVRTCKKHADLPGPALAEQLLKHNRKKNEVVRALVDAGADREALSVSYDAQDNFVIRGATKEAIDEVIANPKVPVGEVIASDEQAELVVLKG